MRRPSKRADVLLFTALIAIALYRADRPGAMGRPAMRTVTIQRGVRVPGEGRRIERSLSVLPHARALRGEAPLQAR
jgi:hypothetical protein